MSETLQQPEGRDAMEVLEEVRARVAACRKEVEASEHEQQLLKKEWGEGNAANQDASAKVEEASAREAAALDNLKSAHAAESVAALALQLRKESHTETSQTFKLLEMEAERKQRLVELDEAKRVAQEAVESSRKSVEESKLKEKEVLQAWKETGKESRANDGTNDGLQDPQAMMAELADIEKLRCIREKERQRMKNELASEGKAKAKSKGKHRAARLHGPQMTCSNLLLFGTQLCIGMQRQLALRGGHNRRSSGIF